MVCDEEEDRQETLPSGYVIGTAYRVVLCPLISARDSPTASPRNAKIMLLPLLTHRLFDCSSHGAENTL